MSESQEQLSDPAEEHRVDLNPEGEGDGYSDRPSDDELEANYATQIESQNNPDEPEAPETGPVEVEEESKVVTTDDIKLQARERRWKQVDSGEDASDES